jgi:FAD/FMN-containing dehydrogenase
MNPTTSDPRVAPGLSSQLIVAGDDGYEQARRVHNGLIDKHPECIARCHDIDDVIAAVRHARGRGLEIAVRGGGHNVAGLATVDGGMMIDLSPMKAVHVDPRSRTARVQPGASWVHFNRATQQFGLATTGGVISSTGVAGLTLGGGYGWMMGRHGMAHDNLVAAQLVSADGELLVANTEAHADLFWALRGGGGNFGIVVWFEFRLHPVDTVLGGLVAYPIAEARRVLRAYRDLTCAGISDDLTIFCGFGRLPDGSAVIALPGCHLGDPETAERELAPFRSLGQPALDAFGPLPYGALNSMQDEAFPRGARNYWKSAFLRELSDATIDVMAAAAETAPSTMSSLTVEHFHGAATRIAGDATAYPHRTAGHNLVLIAQWLDPAGDTENIAWAREAFAELQPHTAEASYVNYLDADDGARLAHAYGANWGRLQEVKRRYDPDNVFHLNHNIDPGF